MRAAKSPKPASQLVKIMPDIEAGPMTHKLEALAELQNGGPLPKPKPWPASPWWHLDCNQRALASQGDKE
jgi:hypothetical protein